MIALRKVCINADQIQAAHNVNAQLDYAGERWAPRHPIPKPEYKTAALSFRPSSVMDFFIDPQSQENDLIIFLQHRGELRFEYDPVLETKLNTLFSVFE